jgi:hypothetical protein
VLQAASAALHALQQRRVVLQPECVVLQPDGRLDNELLLLLLLLFRV